MNTMTGSVRKRISKWDVIAELPLPAESGQDNAQLVKTDGQSMDKESFQADKITKWSELRDSSNRISSDPSEMYQSPKQTEIKAGNENVLKQSYWEPLPGNQATAEDEDHMKTRETRDETIERNDGTGRSFDSRGIDRWRQRSPSISPRSGWGRSHRSKSRSRSRSRSRSPYRLRRGSERWGDRGRMGAGGLAAQCRDFTAGRCRRGSECRYLHESGGRRHSDRHFDSGSAVTRESRFDRGRYSVHDSKESTIDSREQDDYSRNKLSKRHGSHYDDDREKSEFHRNSRPIARCYDFTKGRCQRGSSCRYAHHNASSDGGWNIKDEARERAHDRGDRDASFGRRLEPHRVATDTPCKYFFEGRCRRGEGCKFSHQGVPHDDRPDYSAGINSCSSWNDPGQVEQAVAMDAANSSQWLSNDNDVKFGASQVMDMEISGFDHQNSQSHNPEDTKYGNLLQESSQKTLTSQEHNTTKEALIARPQHEMNSAGNLITVASAHVQNFGQGGHSHYGVPQSVNAQSFSPNVPIQQLVPPLPFNGQVQQVLYALPQNGQSQISASQTPSNNQNIDINIQSLPVPPPPHIGPSQQSYNPRGQIQQNFLLPPHNAQNQQNFNSTGQVQHTIPSHNGQSQLNFNLGARVQQGLSHNLQGQQNLHLSGHSQQSHPPPQNGLNQFMILQPTSNPQTFNLDGQNQQNHSTSQQPMVRADTLEEKPSQSRSDTPLTPKVVTSEQAAQITNLSASLARFFGSAALNPHATGLAPSQPLLTPSSGRAPVPSIQLNQAPLVEQDPTPTSNAMEIINSGTDNLPPGFEQKDPRGEDTQTNMRSFPPSSDAVGTDDGNPIKSNNDVELKLQQASLEPKQEQVKPDVDNANNEVNKAEPAQSKKEQTAHAEDVDDDIRTDGESKRNKDEKGIRMFKCALVEFVKDTLKPSWKEGHLSKEAHKTIVKKVVDKVTGAMQGPNIPQSQEKIELYLSHSKVKLNKLVQAYVEKYVKS